MFKKPAIVFICALVLATGVFGLFWLNRIDFKKSISSNQIDLLHTYIPKKIVTREEVNKAWDKLPADSSLNAGNSESACEGPFYETHSLNKIIAGNAYPLFLIDDQLIYGTSSRSSYAFHGDDVWYLGVVGCGKIIKADRNTFRPINYKNAVDKNHAYFEYRIVEGADIATYGMYKDYGEWWTGDKNSIFYRGEKISSRSGMQELGNGWLKTDTKILYNTWTTEVTDIDSFVFIKNTQFQKDKDHVYVQGVILDGVDPSTFIAVGAYFKDKNRVYYPYPHNEDLKESDPMSSRLIVQNVDGNTFQQVNGSYQYYKDKNGIYTGDGEKLTPFTGVDVNTFEVLGECGCVEKSCGYYSKDNNHVFCGTTQIKDADPKTFTIIGSFENSGGMSMRETIAKDKNCVYQQELPFLKSNGQCVAPAECTSSFIDQKNGKLCGYPFSMGRDRPERTTGN